MKNPFKVGDRVLWTKACPNMCSTGGGGITCFAPPCDTTPGTVIGVGSGVRDPNPGGHVVDDPADLVLVQHDSGGKAGWTADALVYEDPAKRAQGTSDESTHGGNAELKTVLAVGLGSIGLIGLGMWWLNRRSPTFIPAADTRFGVVREVQQLIQIHYTPCIGDERGFERDLREAGLRWIGWGGGYGPFTRDLDVCGHFDEGVIRQAAEKRGIKIVSIDAEPSPDVCP